MCENPLIYLENPVLISDDVDSDWFNDSFARSTLVPKFSASLPTDTSEDIPTDRDSPHMADLTDLCEVVPSQVATTASPLMESLDVAAGYAHLATTLSATEGSPSSQESQAKSHHGCYDDLSKDELYDPSLYPVVRSKRAKLSRMSDSHLLGAYFLWESSISRSNNTPTESNRVARLMNSGARRRH